MRVNQKRDKKIYIHFMKNKETRGVKSQLAKKYKVSRARIGTIIKNEEIRNLKEKDKDRKWDLWNREYLGWYISIPQNRTPAAIAEMRKLMKAMTYDGYTTKELANFLNLDDSTVRYHFKHITLDDHE